MRLGLGGPFDWLEEDPVSTADDDGGGGPALVDSSVGKRDLRRPGVFKTSEIAR